MTQIHTQELQVRRPVKLVKLVKLVKKTHCRPAEARVQRRHRRRHQHLQVPDGAARDDQAFQLADRHRQQEVRQAHRHERRRRVDARRATLPAHRCRRRRCRRRARERDALRGGEPRVEGGACPAAVGGLAPRREREGRRAPTFFQISWGACRRRTPRTRADLECLQTRLTETYPTLSVRRWHVAKSC